MSSEYRTTPDSCGAVLVEAMISLGLIAILALSFSQLFASNLAQMSHYALVTELAMGPQLNSLSFDQDDAIFEDITGDDYTDFLNEIGNFFLERRAGNESLSISLQYLSIDSTSGEITAVSTSNNVVDYPNPLPGDCASVNYESAYQSYMTEKMNAMSSYTVSGASPPVGSKLYRIAIGASVYQRFIDRLPVVFLRVCTDSWAPIWPRDTVTYHMLIPRQLVNG